MKTALSILSVLCLSFALTNTLTAQTISAMETDTVSIEQTSSCTALTSDMRLGSRDARTNGQVTDLQAYLQENNYLSSDPTGYFGSMTQRAVQAFQRRNNITPNGLVGPLTRAKIKTISCGDYSSLSSSNQREITASTSVTILETKENPPYIAGVDYKNGIITITGTRINLANNYLEINGSGHSRMSKFSPSSTSVSADISFHELSPGAHSVQISNVTTGASNRVVFNVTAPSSNSHTSLNSPVLVRSSPLSQAVVGGTTFGIATFKLSTATAGTNTTVRELRFTTTGTDAIESITVGGVTASVISGGVTVVSGLSIPVYSYGTDVPVTVKFSGFQNTIPGGSLTSSVPDVRVSLVYQEAANQGVVIVNKDTATSNTMTLVASMPTVTVPSVRGATLVLGSENKIGEFTVSADANGKISLTQVQLIVSGFINNFAMSAARVAFGTVTVPQAQTAISGNKITIQFEPVYEVFPGQSKTFSVYATVNGTLPYVGAAGFVASHLSREGFIWRDVVGGNTHLTGSVLYNFPLNSYRTGESSIPVPEVKPAPTCEILSDKSSYKYGDKIIFTYKSSGATYAAWIKDTSGKDNLYVPGDKLETNGIYTVTANVVGNPSVTLGVYSPTGSSRCVKTVEVQENVVSSPLGTYVGYMNGNVFITTNNISKEEALQNCKTNAANNSNSSVRCTWKASGGTEEEIYKQDSTSTTTSSPVTTSGPKTNIMSCSRSVTTKYPINGGHACYGIWDYGEEFGGDKDMCPQYSYSGGTGGCVIATPVCQSGYAVADSPVKPKDISDASIWMNLGSSKDIVNAQVLQLWVYRCANPPQASISSQPSVLGVSTACTLINTDLQRGNESAQTRVLQEFLTKRGLLTEGVTGFYGDKTVAAVKNYQSAKGLAVTGMVYEKTRSAIEADTCR